MSTAYQIVQEEEIEHKNEYYELHLINNSQQERIFFSTNQENLEQAARQIIDDMGIEVEKWHIIPHVKH